jgi:predicted ABC-type transport system involved in lysophospholipase L1 biosynthesis ATPase subunit|uniref:ABC transporter ATP-binding protein n=1 Tax=Desulfobacca acetoxidans TaxID=60893 RepID=A0A7C5ETM0_9BACT
MPATHRAGRAFRQRQTTLLFIMGMVLRPTEGRIILKDQDITEYNDEQAATLRLKEYGYVLQQPLLIGENPRGPGNRRSH